MLYIFVAFFILGILYGVVHYLRRGAHCINRGSGSDFLLIFNPLVMASVLIAYGAVGMISMQGLRQSAFNSSILSIAMAGVVGGITYFGVAKVMVHSTTGFTCSESDLIGMDAEVVITIPSNGLGEISIVVCGVKQLMKARSQKAENISRGVLVSVMGISGNVAIVEKKVSANEVIFREKDLNQA